MENSGEGYNFSMENRFEDVKRVFAEWNNCHSAYYSLRPEDFQWHQARQNWLKYEQRNFGGIPSLVSVATEVGIQAGVSPKTLWVSVWGDVRGKEANFVDDSILYAKGLGKTRIYLGSDEFHFLPGVPEEDVNLLEVLTKEGFQFAEASDFSGLLDNEQMNAYLQLGVKDAELGGWSLRELKEDQFFDFSSYMQKEFPGRWAREFLFWSKLQKSPAFWNELVDSSGNRKGFSRLALRGNFLDEWMPGALRLPLHPLDKEQNTDSCLGPIGISASERGKGAGKFLLALSLQKLLRRGAVRVSIDWTNAYNYYKPLGLQKVRNYRSAWRDF